MDLDFSAKKHYSNNTIPVLITCYHVLDEDYIKNSSFLFFSYYSSEGIIDFNIQRIIFQDEELDITIIEIKEEDNLDIYSFLEIDNSINASNPQILNHKIYLLHYPKGVDDVRFSQGEILNISSSNIMFLTDYWPEPGSSGSPIIDYENDLVVGIHKGGKKEDNNKSNNGLGIMLKYAVEEFIKKKREEINCFYKNLYPQSETMDMIYIIPNNKPIHIFCGKFVERYKEKCEII